MCALYPEHRKIENKTKIAPMPTVKTDQYSQTSPSHILVSNAAVTKAGIYDVIKVLTSSPLDYVEQSAG